MKFRLLVSDTHKFHKQAKLEGGGIVVVMVVGVRHGGAAGFGKVNCAWLGTVRLEFMVCDGRRC